MPSLSESHADQLTASGVDREIARARGYYTESDGSALGRLGFSPFQRRTPALVIPVWGIQGRVVQHMIRPDRPRTDGGGRETKYEVPTSSRQSIDVHPSIRTRLLNRAEALFITEGVKKADAAASRGLCCIALPGVWNWKNQEDFWDQVPLDGRRAYVVFDSDVRTNPQVWRAAVELAEFLRRRKVEARFITLPSGEDGRKVGLDDYLAGAGTADQLLSFASDEPPPRPADEAAPDASWCYEYSPEGLFRVTQSKQRGEERTRLTDFGARIVEQLTITDGVEERKEFVIEAIVRGEPRRVSVPAEDFERLGWVLTHLGPMAIVAPGFGKKDEVRAAVQAVSGEVPDTKVFTHLGWAKCGGRWVFLHADGAIQPDPSRPPARPAGLRSDHNPLGDNEVEEVGPIGPIPAPSTSPSPIRVRVPDSLKLYALPDPGRVADLAADVAASMKFLELGPPRVVMPIYAAIWRAAMDAADFSLHVSGPTGVGKSELVALAMQHFGAGMDSRHLPGSWLSTANSLAATAFLAKNVLFAVDDFVPTGSQSDVERAHRDADRLLRSQGNHAGRGRCNRDGTPKEAKPPRCLIISTGEDIPMGQSLNARILNVELDRADVLDLNDRGKLERLSAAQAAGTQGAYARTMAGFLAWLAPRYEAELSKMRSLKTELRDDFRDSCQHARAADIAADLGAGLDAFLMFAHDLGVLDEEGLSRMADNFWEALLVSLGHQKLQQSSNDPCDRFLSLLRAALTTGKAHVAFLADEPAEDATCSARLWGYAEKLHREPIEGDEAPLGSAAPSADQADPPRAEPLDEGGRDGSGSGAVSTRSGEPRHERRFEERVELIPRGPQVGWKLFDNLYLDIEATLAVVQKLAKDAGQPPIPLTQRSLGKRLDQRGLLASKDDGHYTRRKMIGGAQLRVLHLSTYSVVDQTIPEDFDEVEMVEEERLQAQERLRERYQEQETAFRHRQRRIFRRRQQAFMKLLDPMV